MFTTNSREIHLQLRWGQSIKFFYYLINQKFLERFSELNPEIWANLKKNLEIFKFLHL